MLNLGIRHSFKRWLLPSRIARRWGSGVNHEGTATTTTKAASEIHKARPSSSSTPIRPPAAAVAVDGNDLHRQGMEQLQKTNPWLYRMAPPRGGTTAPDAKFMAVFAVVGSVGFYAWFVDPPSAVTTDETDALTKSVE